MEYRSLVPHPKTPPIAIASIQVGTWRDGDRWHFRHLVDGTNDLILPDPAEPSRADQLWQTTCFEAFVGTTGQTYREYNFSASGQWAAYTFDAPRLNMRNADDQVETWLDLGDDWIAVEAAVSAGLVAGSPLGLAAVIEETGGHKSYWALAHPDGPPDFHDPTCFRARLPE